MAIKVGDVIDYTRKRSLPVCPTCGRHGVEHRYPKESFDLFEHKSRYEGWCFNMTDTCAVKKDWVALPPKRRRVI